jgi:hypothetical protein
MDGGDADDAAPIALLRHLLRRPLRAEKVAFQAGRHRAVPDLLGDLQERPVLRPVGVVHQDIDAAVGRQEGVEQAIHLRPTARVGDSEARLPARALDETDRLLRFRIPLHVVETDIAARPRQGERDRAPDASP